jgi:ubiquinone biosynthesis protein UbiJ
MESVEHVQVDGTVNLIYTNTMLHIAENTTNTAQTSEVSIKEDFTSGQQFVGLISKESLSASIGESLLNLKKNDSIRDIQTKMRKAITSHPEHLAEVLLCGLTAITIQSESKEEILESMMLSFQLADQNTKQ